MDNYIIIKTNDGIVKFEGDLINCDIDNTSETTTVYDTNKTTLATFLVAGEPFAIATEQSAFFMANTSLTPSPVIATVLLFLC